MNEADLKTKSEIAAMAGKSPAAVSKAIKKGRLEVFGDTGLINVRSPKTIRFIGDRGPGQSLPAKINGDSVSKSDDDFTQVLIDREKEQAKKIKEDAELTKQKRIEKEMKNAVKRSELYESDLVNRYLMTLLDRQRNANRREFAANFDVLKRDLREGVKSDNEIKRKYMNLFDSWHFDAVHEVEKEMQELDEQQAKT